MKRAALLLILLLPICISAQVTLVWKNSSEFPDSLRSPVYVAGNFNGWQPADTKYMLREEGGEMLLHLTVPQEISNIEFKCTRGSWEDGEVDAAGGFSQNHTAPNTAGMRVEFEITAFQNMQKQTPKERNPNVEEWVMHSKILDADKTIRVYVPCAEQEKDNRYNVLYMLDGQNLFDDVFAYSGEWGVDEMMDSVCGRSGVDAAIIVGIDNAGADRMLEYFPWTYQYTGLSGKGYGDLFSDFVAEELKPRIDSMYRTKKDRASTGIAGSSMGGLMSLYMLLDHPEVFSKAGIFSPSFQVSDSNFVFAKQYAGDQDIDLYFLCGALEGGDQQMMTNMENMYTLLLNKQNPHIRMRMLIQSDALHTESFWRKELFDMYRWLFAK